jgi:hypothetical protein
MTVRDSEDVLVDPENWVADCEECGVPLSHEFAVELSTGSYCETCAHQRPDADGRCAR